MFVHDIRSYYEELAFEIADGPLIAYGAERWFYDETEAGKVILDARRKMKQSDARSGREIMVCGQQSFESA